MTFDLFRNRGRRARFAPSVDPFQVPQEVAAGYGHIQPFGFVEPGVIDVSSFAETIAPVQLVSSNPALPDAAYPEDSWIYNTTDKKLYKNVANVWEYVVGDEEITADMIAANTITAGEIAAGAIGATEIATGAIHIGHMSGDPANLAPNPSFEFLDGQPVATNGITIPGWVLGAQGQISSAVTAHSGSNAARLIQAASPALQTIEGSFVPVVAGRPYRARVWTRGITGNGATVDADLRVRFYDASFAQLSSNLVASRTDVGTSATWEAIQGFVTSDALAVYAKVALQMPSAGSASGDRIFFDDVELYAADKDINASDGDVLVDSSGVTIRGGKLTLEDEFGSTVANAGGFGGGWFDFINLGLYNGRFLNGTVGTIANGRTADMPYWTLSNQAGSPVATGLAGGGLEVTFAALNNKKRLLSDLFPVRAMAFYGMYALLDSDWVAGLIVLDAVVEWYQADGVTPASPSTSAYASISFSSSTASADEFTFDAADAQAPLDAAYAKLRLDVSEITTHNAGNALSIFGVTLREIGADVDAGLTNFDVGSLTTTNAQGGIGLLQGEVFRPTALFDLFFNEIAPAQIVANTDNYNPAGLATAAVLRINSDAARNLTGIVAPSVNNLLGGKQTLLLENVGAFTITLVHNLTSTAANRFTCPGAVNFSLTTGRSVLLRYSTTDSRWRVIG